jgi:hypothetical protein
VFSWGGFACLIAGGSSLGVVFFFFFFFVVVCLFFSLTFLQSRRFNGGGHLNHSIFWTNLAPPKQGGGDAPTGALLAEINKTFGSLQKFQVCFKDHLSLLRLTPHMCRRPCRRARLLCRARVGAGWFVCLFACLFLSAKLKDFDVFTLAEGLQQG